MLCSCFAVPGVQTRRSQPIPNIMHDIEQSNAWQEYLDDALGRGSPVGDAAEASYLSVPVDVEESTEAYTFTADVPGVSRANTKVRRRKSQEVSSL